MAGQLYYALLWYAGRLITVRGIVVRASPVRQLILSMEFACLRCGCRQRASFPDGAAARPAACSDGCRSRGFTPILDSAHSVAWQRIRLQVIDLVTLPGIVKLLSAESTLQRRIRLMSWSALMHLEVLVLVLAAPLGAGCERIADTGLEAAGEYSGSWTSQFS